MQKNSWSLPNVPQRYYPIQMCNFFSEVRVIITECNASFLNLIVPISLSHFHTLGPSFAHSLHSRTCTAILARPPRANNIINSEKECGGLHIKLSYCNHRLDKPESTDLNCSLQCLNLHACRFKEPVRLHVRHLSSLAINTIEMLPFCMLGLNALSVIMSNENKK